MIAARIVSFLELLSATADGNSCGSKMQDVNYWGIYRNLRDYSGLDPECGSCIKNFFNLVIRWTILDYGLCRNYGGRLEPIYPATPVAHLLRAAYGNAGI